MGSGNGHITADALRSFVSALFEPDDLIEFRPLPPGDGWHRDWIRARDVESIVPKMKEANETKSVYIGATPKNGRGGEKEHTALYRAVYADIDDLKDLEHKEALRVVQDRINSAKLPMPTIVVYTGGGFQLWWRLTKPLTDLFRGETVVAKLSVALDGDSKVKDHSHVMRAPGFRNRKPKYVAGYRPLIRETHPLANIEYIQPDNAYDIEDLERRLAGVKVEQKTQQSGKPSKAENDDAVIKVGERDATLTSHAGAMRRRGMTPDAILAALREQNKHCETPLSDEDLQRITRSIGKKAPAQKTYGLTEVGNAKRFADQHEGVVRYCEAQRTFWCFNETHWEENQGKPKRLMIKTIKSIADEAFKLPDDKSELRTKMVKWSGACMTNSKLEASLAIAKALAPLGIRASDLDRDIWLLNVLNGTIDLRTGKIRDHDPADLITKVAPVEFDRTAKSELWERHIQMVCTPPGEDTDQEMVVYLQRTLGLAMTGDTSRQQLYMNCGPGATGKSTTMETVRKMLGGYAVTSDFEAFLKRNTSGGATPHIARLRGSRIVVGSEVEQGRELAQSLLKSLTGNDTMAARDLYQKTIEFEPTFTIFLICNHLPRADDLDGALWRRIRVLPFLHEIPPDQRDPSVPRRLWHDPIEQSGVLNWMLQGCRDALERGIQEPEAVKAATQAYREDNNPLGDFFEQECVEGAECIVPVADLRSRYDDWCKRMVVRYPLSVRKFNERLSAKGFERKKARYNGEPKLCWHGVGLQPGEGSSRWPEGFEDGN